MRFPPAQGVLSPTQSGQPDGVPTLDANAVVPQDQLIPNTLSHAGALTALYNFNGSTSSTRGQRGQFSRASAANNPQTLASLPNDAPSYVWSKWGSEALALSVWEGTTNLVYNSDFEVVTTTAQLFSDNITTSAAWTAQNGSFIFAALLANPTAAPTLSTATTGGSLAAATYYVVYTWENAYGQTMASPEASITTTGTTSTVTVTVPTLPDGATLTGIYMSTSTGTETLQGTTATTSYTQSAALVAGAALPTSNTAQLGATSTATGSLITAGNIAWKPLLGSDGSTSLPLTAQATFTQPPTVGLQHLGLEQSFSGGETGYRIEITGGTMYLSKVSAGTPTNLSTVAETLSASTTYTMTLSLDHLGNLTAKLYSGAGTGGTLLQTLTATDTSLSGGFLIGVGGDTGVVVSNASVTGAWANGWVIGGDLRVAWGLASSSVINGTYSVSAVGIPVTKGYIFPATNLTATSSDPYTISGYMSTSSLGTSGAYFQYDTLNSTPSIISGGSTFTPTVTGTTVTTRYDSMETISSTAVSIRPYCVVNDSGTVTFDCIQVEQKSYMTPYVQNNSTTATATRAAETMTVPSSVLSASEGTISFEWIPYMSTSTVSSNNDAFNILQYGNPGTDGLFLRYNNTGDIGGVQFGGLGVTPPIYTGGWSVGESLLLTVAWANGTASCYVKGSLVGTGLWTPPVNPTAIYVLYRYGWLQGNSAISNLAFFNRALTAQEVYSIYASTQPLVDALATPIASDNQSISEKSLNIDANGNYTTVQQFRRDGTMLFQSVLSGTPSPSGSSNYPTMTWTFYDSTGINVEETVTYALTYDSNGNVIAKEVQ